MRFLTAAFLSAAFVRAQPGCPPVNFQNVISTSTQPSASSHLTFVRQADGSYTAYEMSDASPYKVTGTTRNFGSELARCMPREASLPPLPPPQGSGNLPGSSSQSEIFARLPSGGYLQVRTLGGQYPVLQTMEFSIFDADMSLVSDTPSSVAAYQFSLADVNGDGKLDLVALGNTMAGSGQGIVVVFPGNGDGTFQAPITTPITVTVGGPGGENATVFSVADVDGDGKPDLVFATEGLYAFDYNLYMMPGNGDGTFGTPRLIFGTGFVSSIALADLNGDGYPDIVFYDWPSGAVKVALGTGGGSFQSPVAYSVASTSGTNTMVAVEDIDGDGHSDIVTNGVSILFGDGKGNFPRRADYLCPTSGGIVLADLNGDGRIDILTGVTGNPLIFIGNNPDGPNMSVLFGREGGLIWSAPISWDTNDLGATTVAVVSADFNGDGLPDLASIELAGNPPVGELMILDGSTSGFFTVADQHSIRSPVAVVTADFNGDGKPDLAVAESFTPPQPNIVHIFANNGHSAFQELSPVILAAGLSVAAVATGDFNRDGKQDLAVLTTTQNGGSTDEALIFLGNGDGSFRAGASYQVGTGASAIATADFNGDGRIDLATANSGTGGNGGSMSVLLGNGDGTFSAALTTPLSGPNGDTPFRIAAADLKSGGKADLAVTLVNNEVGIPPALAVLLGHDDGTFSAPVLYSVTGNEVTIADLNGDGVPDLVVPPCYLLGNGDGTFAPEVLLADGVGPLVAANLHPADIEMAPGTPYRFGFDWDSGISLVGSSVWGAIAFPNATRPQHGIHGRRSEERR
jgi:hypothetical protein